MILCLPVKKSDTLTGIVRNKVFTVSLGLWALLRLHSGKRKYFPRKNEQITKKNKCDTRFDWFLKYNIRDNSPQYYVGIVKLYKGFHPQKKCFLFGA